MKKKAISLLFILGGIMNHLYSYPFTQNYLTAHFNIHYNVDSVPSRKDKSYISPNTNPAQLPEFGDPDWEDDPNNPGGKRRTIPYYILDIGKNMEKALEVYVKMGLVTYSESTTPPKSSLSDDAIDLPDTVTKVIDVYVKALTDSKNNPIDGENDAKTGNIYINQNVPTSPDLPNKVDVLKKACAHELLHHVTYRKYSGLLAAYSTYSDALSQQWWWECLATQGDRLVFPNQKNYEAESYAMTSNAIYNNIPAAWDVVNADPNWYVSSSFLTYLIYYRPDKKADFAKIFFAPIKDLSNSTSYIRTSLDKYVKEELGSKGLGYEYQAYLRWLMAIQNPHLCLEAGNDARPYIESISLKPDNFTQKTQYNALQPYMSMKVYRIVQALTAKDKMYTVKNHLYSQDEMMEIAAKAALNNELLDKCNVFVYECTKWTRKELIQLAPSDSLNISYEQGKWIEVALINPSLNNSGNAAIEIIRYPTIAGKFKGKVEFSGTNPSLDAMYTISISDLHIELTDSGTAICDFEFHKSYKKDGFYAKGKSLRGTVDKSGNVLIIGAVEAFTYPKGSQGCCDFPQVKDDPNCIKMKANPYFWKFEGKIGYEGTKRKITGYIAAGLNPRKFMKASEKLYKFTVEEE